MTLQEKLDRAIQIQNVMHAKLGRMREELKRCQAKITDLKKYKRTADNLIRKLHAGQTRKSR